MHRNNPLKSRKLKKVNPATNPATLNVVTFGFRDADENKAIQSRCVEWAPLESESREKNSK